MDTDAESLPNCCAIAWGNCPEQQIPLVAFSLTTLEESPHILKDYPDLTKYLISWFKSSRNMAMFSGNTAKEKKKPKNLAVHQNCV